MIPSATRPSSIVTSRSGGKDGGCADVCRLLAGVGAGVGGIGLGVGVISSPAWLTVVVPRGTRPGAPALPDEGTGASGLLDAVAKEGALAEVAAPP